ncbi:3-methyl-2-oxobutanoate hydroxymethyltransferase [Idiomarina sp. HP20-50]|uniref:3-methyl-2-oxobutanoate hydroxymethyltransferase n=1 Tax=Idiomarina sp. HP20-50 TaxID=3070813 RepID=UPI00294B8E95|nr:3-methyl-2-oxobutanoate hydroxymethyltransferase [Idiomarina sp. HP20-50]MDV6316246.1 3-methyl-2-oxobutanoate hydroxymethyltransferase [Idiomarina sp. HP20-50]
MSNKVTLPRLAEMKRNNEKFSCITCYDATFSAAINEANSETILVGDALGMVLQGHDSTVPVTMEHMIYHTESVVKANSKCLILSDLPFMSYTNEEEAINNAKKLLQAGANVIKIEGDGTLAPIVESLTKVGAPVCAHLGLTPQYINAIGNYRVFGKSEEESNSIFQAAVALEDAGAVILVLECVPEQLAKRITEAVSIPVIGIGSGKHTDGQVLVLHDLIGLTRRPPKFVKNFMEGQPSIQSAISSFVDSVKEGSFPEKEHTYT